MKGPCQTSTIFLLCYQQWHYPLQEQRIAAYQLLIGETKSSHIKLAYYKIKGKTSTRDEQETGNIPPGWMEIEETLRRPVSSFLMSSCFSKS